MGNKAGLYHQLREVYPNGAGLSNQDMIHFILDWLKNKKHMHQILFFQLPPITEMLDPLQLPKERFWSNPHDIPYLDLSLDRKNGSLILDKPVLFPICIVFGKRNSLDLICLNKEANLHLITLQVKKANTQYSWPHLAITGMQRREMTADDLLQFFKKNPKTSNDERCTCPEGLNLFYRISRAISSHANQIGGFASSVKECKEDADRLARHFNPMYPP